MEPRFITDPHNPDTHEYLFDPCTDMIIGERWFGYPGATGLRYFDKHEEIHIDDFRGELGHSWSKYDSFHYRKNKIKALREEIKRLK